MRLTDPRISHLSHRLRNALQKGGLADFPDEPAAHREAKAVLDSYADAEEAVEAFARDRISRLSRKVPEGGRFDYGLEVLLRQDDDTQTFLLLTSVLERFSAELADAVTGGRVLIGLDRGAS